MDMQLYQELTILLILDCILVDMQHLDFTNVDITRVCTVKDDVIITHTPKYSIQLYITASKCLAVVIADCGFNNIQCLCNSFFLIDIHLDGLNIVCQILA